MEQIKRTTDDVYAVMASIEKTRDRFEAEGHDRDDEALELLNEFCTWLLDGDRANPRDVNSFLTGQDLEV